MSQIAKKHLLAGIIFGDPAADEYIYLPGGEVGTEQPLCIYEHDNRQEDIDLETAGYLVGYLSLKKCSHPVLGKRAF
ncbi:MULTISPECIES: hypothetical protein [Megasphaera]|uniref:Uncharacterized protein n=1 Tax=Megasphaera vaginalis (ex Srinivasan et al. 2021) TaxID=1111454 RepID=U7UT82_9FIRM|nr:MULTISPECIES: hypothetical protein [Megasphaera]ERT61643.1 hypothetical protein HMPREF1250_2251 [Megasphaera vaginalis (ex Srinivasan et al. 2021)]